MLNKGVSPILATVLIMLITVAAGGAFLIYWNNQQSQLEERGGEQIEEIRERLDTSFEISSLSCENPDTIIIKNTGKRPFQGQQMTLIVNGTILTAPSDSWVASGGCTGSGTSLNTSTVDINEGCLLQAQWNTNQMSTGQLVSIQIEEASSSRVC